MLYLCFPLKRAYTVLHRSKLDKFGVIKSTTLAPPQHKY
jgi:hypothetical protein